MEFLSSEIARLVLGYLEEAKCDEAYEMFLKTSLHLQECLKMKEEGRKFHTQVLGLSLLDILYEYSAIYSLVQERLKKVDPETASSLKASGNLLDKITFLLNATSSGQTMLFSITLPPGKSPQTSTVAHVRKRMRTSSCEKRKDLSRKTYRPQTQEPCNLNESVAKYSNLETTTLSSLPGSSSTKRNLSDNQDEIIYEDDDISRTPKRKTISNSRKSRANSVIPEENEDNVDLTMLTKALLDNHELHEKIAENINKAICTPDLSTSINFSGMQDLCKTQNSIPELNNSLLPPPNNVTMELDNVIKKIVQDTESDPLFENFLHEVVGPDGSSDDYDDRVISETSTPCQSTPETVKKQIPLKHRLRSSKTKLILSPGTSPGGSPTRIDHQNAAAIENIISINVNETEKVSINTNLDTVLQSIETIPKEFEINQDSKTETQQTTITTTDVQTAIVTTTIENEISQPLTVDTTTPTTLTVDRLIADQKVLSTTTNLTNPTNRSNLLMLNPQNSNQTQPQPQQIILDTITPLYQQPIVSSENRIYLVNKLGAIGPQILTVQQTPYQSQTVISESDILSMPTVIMCDERPSTSTIIIPPPPPPKPVYTKPVITRRPRVQPIKMKSDKPDHLNCPPTCVSCQEQIKSFTAITEAAGKVPESELIKYTIQYTLQSEPKTASTTVSEQQQSQAPEQSVSTETTTENNCRSVPMIPMSSGKKNDNDKPDERKTPEDKSVAKIPVSRSTPRNNRSHIRALDFSTPTKEEIISPRKAFISPKAQSGKKTVKTPKRLAKKGIRTTLYTSPVKPINMPIATRSPRTKLSGVWSKINGADLILGTDKTPAKQDDAATTTTLAKKKTTKTQKSEKIISEPIDEPSSDIETQMEEDKTGRRSWDDDLRKLVQSVEVKSKKKSAATRKRTTRTRGTQNADAKKKIEEEGKSIETELLKLEDKTNEKVTQKEENSNPKETEKHVKTTKKKRQTNKTRSTIQKVELNVKEECKDKEDAIIKMEEKHAEESESQDTLLEGLRNMKPRMNKKCNIGNLKNKSDSQIDENTDESKSMTVLFPSKKNANKRTLIEQTEPLESVTKTESVSITITSSAAVVQATTVTETTTTTNKITPDIFKPSCSNAITAAKRNLTPILETPMKTDLQQLPMTPRMFTPFSESPFSRLFNEKCDTIDLALIPTPSFPLTPLVPITPNPQIGDSQSSYVSRPTDYSNSSSYYLPSDSEQNQKLEQVLIEECMKIESSKLLKSSTPFKSTSTELVQSDTKNQSRTETISQNDLVVLLEKCPVDAKILAKTNESNESLNASKCSQCSSTDSSCSTSSCSTDTSDTSTTSEENANETITTTTTTPNATVIHIERSNRYSLRRAIKTPSKLRDSIDEEFESIKIENKTKLDNSDNKEKKQEPIKLIIQKRKLRKTPEKKHLTAAQKQQRINPKEIKNSKVTSSHATLLKELEQKRKRIVTGLKNEPIKAKVNRPKKAPTVSAKPRGRPKKNAILPTIANKNSENVVKLSPKLGIKKPKPRKSIESVLTKLREKEIIPTKDNSAVLRDKNLTNESEDVICLNTSIEERAPNRAEVYSEEEEIPRLHISSDEEQSLFESNVDLALIKDLKERGIHLIPKKSVKKKMISPEETAKSIKHKNEKDTNVEENNSDKETKNSKIEIKSVLYLDRTEKIDITKISSTLSVPTDTISCKSAKIKSIDKNTQNEIDEKLSDEKIEIENSENSFINSFDKVFDIETISENKSIHIVYNETEKSNKSLTDYNLNVLNRIISATVFVEELNIEQEKKMTVTPFINFFAMSPTDQSKDELNLKPLDVLYNELVEENSSSDCNDMEEKSEKVSRKTESKDEKIVQTKTNLSEKEKKIKPIKNIIKSEASTSKCVKNTITLEHYRNKISKKISETVKDSKTEMNKTIPDEIVDDDLMTYALVGEQLTETQSQDISSKKRKLTSDTDSLKHNTDKRVKTNDKQCLLLSTDLESFLSKVHGPSDRFT